MSYRWTKASLFCFITLLALCSPTFLAAQCDPEILIHGGSCPAGASATPASGLAPLSTTLNAWPAVTEVQPPFNYYFDHWDFGDGQTSTTQQVSHTYATPGTYTAQAFFDETSRFDDGDPSVVMLASVVVTVTAPRTITALALSPATQSIMVGDENATLRLQDQTGQPVNGAVWSVDNATALGLTTDDPPLLSGLTPGIAKVTASFGSLSAQSTVTVFPYGPGHRFPTGTVISLAPPVPGFIAAQMIRTTPGTSNTPDFIGTQFDPNNQNGWLAVGLTSGGQQLWQAPLTQYVTPASQPLVFCCFNIPDSSGGLLSLSSSVGNFYVTALTRIDGATGLKAWHYDSPGQIDRDIAVRSDGNIFTVETQPIPGATGSHSYLEQIDEKTGTVVQSTLLPTGHFSQDGGADYDDGAFAGPIAVLPDGSVAVSLSTQFWWLRGDSTQTMTNTLYLAVLHADNTFGLQTLAAVTGTCNGCGSPNITNYAPEEVIPDGQGGMLVFWGGAAMVPVGNLHVSHTNASGSILAQYDLPVPANGATYDHMVLGDQGMVFFSNQSNILAFNAADGSVLSNTDFGANNHTIQPLAAVWGGGLAIADNDLTNATQTVSRLDANGTLTSNGFNSLGLAPNVTWPTLGVWYGVNSSGNGYQQTAGDEIVPAQSVWGFPGGNPSANRQPTTVTESMPFWGKTKSVVPPDIPDCAKPIVLNSVTLPPSEPVTQGSTLVEDQKLYARLNKWLNRIISTNSLASQRCATFFSDPSRAAAYSHLPFGVVSQAWYNGHLSVINLWDAGMYELPQSAQSKAVLQTQYVSCEEFDEKHIIHRSDGSFSGVLGMAQIQPPANSGYYNGGLIDYIEPSTLVHESLHNVTGLDDADLRTFLGIQPNDGGSYDISVKLVSVGCSPTP